MNVTEKQKAYHFRKMRTRTKRMDINKDGFISREDYELMSKRFAEYSRMTEQEAEDTYTEFMKIADALNFKPGIKIPLELAARQITDQALTMSAEQRKVLLYDQHNMLFDIFDTNKDGHISQQEFKVYFQVMAPSTPDEAVTYSFNVLDANKDGKISRGEFLTAAEDFFLGLEETEVSRVFMGELVD